MALTMPRARWICEDARIKIFKHQPPGFHLDPFAILHLNSRTRALTPLPDLAFCYVVHTEGNGLVSAS